jgi:lysophospholipase L1-like esterase
MIDKIKIYYLIFFMIFLPLTVFSQFDSLRKMYPFLKISENSIAGDSLFWKNLGVKLDSLKQRGEVLNIVHIGDSHLQAGFLTAVVRQGLQKRYGNAGPGLLVPYKVGRTNEPPHVRSKSPVRWRARRIVSDKDTLAIGLSGLTVQARRQDAEMEVQLVSPPGLDYSISALQVFSRSAAGEMPVAVCDSTRCVMALVDPQKPAAQIRFERPVSRFMLVPQPGNEDSLFTLFGMNGMNDSAGIRYHTIAINGAEYRHYLQQELFFQQMAYLSPDLFVVSLGTNEAFSVRFDTLAFRQQVDSMLMRLSSAFPKAGFLLVCPGDAMKGRKYKNPRNRRAGTILQSVAVRRGWSSWDLFSVMGGYGSIQKWYSKGLTAKDKLHLNRRGYELQGYLLLSALLKAMNRDEH